VPETLEFQTKPQIALTLIQQIALVGFLPHAGFAVIPSLAPTETS